MKKALHYFIALAAAMALLGFLPTAQASVNLVAGPTSLAPTATSLAANSQPLPLFSFTLSNTANETLSGVMLQIHNPNASVAASSNQIGQLSLYKDNGSGLFNSDSSNLIGSQSNVTSSSTVSISPNLFTPANGKFYVSFASSFYWTNSSPQNTIVVTLPANGITTSAGQLITPALATATILASGTTMPVLVSATAENTGGTTAVEAGDSIVLAFSKAMNKFGISSSNITSQFTISNGHSFLDGSGNLGSVTWNSDGTILTLNFSGPSFNTQTPTAPTIAPGDTITMAATTGIADLSGNRATGSVRVNGSLTGASTLGNPSLTAMLSSISVTPNSPVYDLATLSNLTGNAGGTVTYNVYIGSSCSGAPIMSSQQSVSAGTVPSSAVFSTPIVGDYSWQVSYSGDGNNSALTGACQPEFVMAAASGVTPANPIAPIPAAGSGLPVTGLAPGLLFLLLALAAAAVNIKLKAA